MSAKPQAQGSDTAVTAAARCDALKRRHVENLRRSADCLQSSDARFAVRFFAELAARGVANHSTSSAPQIRGQSAA